MSDALQSFAHGVGRDLGAESAQAVEREQLAAVVLEQHDVLERRALVADLGELGGLGGVLADDDPGARVREHVSALRGRVSVVDRRDHGAGAQRAAVGERPLSGGQPEDRDAVAGIDAQADQAARDLGRDGAELGV